MSAAARYQAVQVQTCSPAQLVVLSFDGILRFLAEAELAMSRKDRARVGERIGRCHGLLEELASSLDKSKAPELCENLEGLYVFCMHRLVEANAAQDPGMLRDVAEVLRPLRDAFSEAMKAAA